MFKAENVCLTYIFDIRAGRDSDHITVLDTQVVANHTVDAGTTIIKVFVGEDNEDCVLSLLAPDKNCVTTEKLELFHGIFGECNDTVVIIDGIGDPAVQQSVTG